MKPKVVLGLIALGLLLGVAGIVVLAVTGDLVIGLALGVTGMLLGTTIRIIYGTRLQRLRR